MGFKWHSLGYEENNNDLENPRQGRTNLSSLLRGLYSCWNLFCGFSACMKALWQLQQKHICKSKPLVPPPTDSVLKSNQFFSAVEINFIRIHILYCKFQIQLQSLKVKLLILNSAHLKRTVFSCRKQLLNHIFWIPDFLHKQVLPVVFSLCICMTVCDGRINPLPLSGVDACRTWPAVGAASTLGAASTKASTPPTTKALMGGKARLIPFPLFNNVSRTQWTISI